MAGVNKNVLTREVSEERMEAFRTVLEDAIAISEQAQVPYIAGGSTASNLWGRPSPIGDIDIIVRPPDAKRLLKAFKAAGYETDESEPQWLYKAKKDGITVDLIFEMEGALYLDDEMLSRAALEEVEGVRLRVMSPEDYVVTQALSTKEETPNYWYNALGVLGKSNLNWDYLLERASHGPRRVLSLLIYGQSQDLPIPDHAIRRLFDTVYGH